MSQPHSGTGERARETADETRHAVGQVADTTKEEAGQVVQEIKNQARDLTGEARSQLTDQANAQRERAVESLRDLSGQLARLSQGSDQDGVAAELVRQAGDRVGSMADFLSKRQPGDLLDEVRRYARQHPGTFLIGAVFAGAAVGRLTRASVAIKSNSQDERAVVTTARPQYVSSRSQPGSAPGAYVADGIPEAERYVGQTAHEPRESLSLPENPAIPSDPVRGDRP